MHKSFNITASSVYPLGARFVPEGLHISAVCEKQTDFGIVLYDKSNKNGVKIPFPKEYRIGNVYSMLLKDYHDRSCSYLLYQGEELMQEPYAMALENNRKYGEKAENPSRCKVPGQAYDWGGDIAPAIPFEESIFYMMHVRGFTKHKSSGVSCRGTYAGVIEKIPYLKELGITAVLLMPSYEFDEVFKEESKQMSMEQAIAAYSGQHSDAGNKEDTPVRVNYWGYKEGLYFMPKYAYSYKKDAVAEFKDMVKALHQNKIEIMMQFYFPPEISYVRMLEILKYWVLEYHIDGFHLMGVDIPMQMLRSEPLLSETKLIGERDDYSGNGIKAGIDNGALAFRNFGFMNDAFLYDMRKLLKGDSNKIDSLMNLCRKNYADRGVINYIAKQDGFRLYDLVSYNDKHNELNGESNQDGIAENYSWNCGVEGKTRKKGIMELRLRQMKNALAFVMLSQGTPLIYSGDEFANSQDGNNNPYCQDNNICWIKWDRLKANGELFNYIKELIALRKAHPILHAGEPLKGFDYISCGFPDISFHGKDAWIPDTWSESRSLGIMYCGLYEKEEGQADNTSFYIAVNMHWEPYRFGLPQLPKGMEWERLMSTYAGEQKPGARGAAEKEAIDAENVGREAVIAEACGKAAVITEIKESGTNETEMNVSVAAEKKSTLTETENKAYRDKTEDIHNILVPPRTIAIYGTKVTEPVKEKRVKGRKRR